MQLFRHITSQLLLRAAILVAPPKLAAQLAPAKRPIWRPGA